MGSNRSIQNVCIVCLLLSILILFTSSCDTKEDVSPENAGDYSHIDIQTYPKDYEDAFSIKDMLEELGYIVVVGGDFDEPYPEPSPVYLVTENYECIFFQEGEVSIEGRQLNEQDIVTGNNVCVVGSDVAPMLFGGEEDVLNMELGLWGDRFQVVGIYEFDDDSQALFTFVPITAAKKIGEVRISYITVCIEKDEDVRDNAREIYDLLTEAGYDISMNYYDSNDRRIGSIPRSD